MDGCPEPILVSAELFDPWVGGGVATPERVNGQYQLPNDPAATVVDASVGNFMASPDNQNGYEISVDASGHAVVTYYPEGSLGTLPTRQPVLRTVELGEGGLQQLLAALDALGLFSLPAPHRTDGAGGTVDWVRVTLADGEWSGSNCCLNVPGQKAQLDAIQATVLDALGINPPGPGA